MMDEWFVPEQLTRAELEIASRHVMFNSMNNNTWMEFKEDLDRAETQIIRNEAFFKEVCSNTEYEYFIKEYGIDDNIW